PHFMQRPVLVIGFEWQTAKLLDLGPGIGITNGLIDPGRANLHLDKRFTRECPPFGFGQRENAIRHAGIEGLQTRKFLSLGLVQLQKREFECASRSAHMCKYTQSCVALQDNPRPEGQGLMPYIPRASRVGFTAWSQ